MNGRWIVGLLLGAAGILILGLSVRVAQSQVGGGYDLTWSTIDGGGASSSAGGTYSLGGTIGQPDAGTSTGGSYTLASGFWGAFGSERLPAHQQPQGFSATIGAQKGTWEGFTEHACNANNSSQPNLTLTLDRRACADAPAVRK